MDKPGEPSRPLSLDEYKRYGRQMIMPEWGLPGELRGVASTALTSQASSSSRLPGSRWSAQEVWVVRHCSISQGQA